MKITIRVYRLTNSWEWDVCGYHHKRVIGRGGRLKISDSLDDAVRFSLLRNYQITKIDVPQNYKSLEEAKWKVLNNQQRKLKTV